VDKKRPQGEKTKFEGGCTLVADLQTQQIRFCIRKHLNSATRLARQQEFALRAAESPAATYFSGAAGEDGREPFALIHRGG